MILLAALLKLALLTSNNYPESNKPDDKLLAEALHEYEIEVQSVNWNSPDVVWTDFDAAIICSTWDYHENYPKFLRFLREIEGLGLKVYNSSSTVEWNSSKKYLKDLESLGLKTIESIFISSKELDKLLPLLVEKGWNDCVIKPQISASGYHTHRFSLSNLGTVQSYFKDLEEELIVQPFAEEIITEGEWSFVFF